jgi:hypothetical protein
MTSSQSRRRRVLRARTGEGTAFSCASFDRRVTRPSSGQRAMKATTHVACRQRTRIYAALRESSQCLLRFNCLYTRERVYGPCVARSSGQIGAIRPVRVGHWTGGHPKFPCLQWRRAAMLQWLSGTDKALSRTTRSGLPPSAALWSPCARLEALPTARRRPRSRSIVHRSAVPLPQAVSGPVSGASP